MICSEITISKAEREHTVPISYVNWSYSPPKPTRMLQGPILFTPIPVQKMAPPAGKSVHNDVSHIKREETCNQTDGTKLIVRVFYILVFLR